LNRQSLLDFDGLRWYSSMATDELFELLEEFEGRVSARG